MNIQITSPSHPYEKTKDDFVLKGAYSEVIILIEQHIASSSDLFSLERQLSLWERENIPQNSSKAVCFLEKLQKELRQGSGDLRALLRDLKENRAKWLDEPVV